MIVRYLHGNGERRGLAAKYPTPPRRGIPMCSTRGAGWSCTRHPHEPTTPHVGHNVTRLAVCLFEPAIIPVCARCGGRIDRDEGGRFWWAPLGPGDEPDLNTARGVARAALCCK